MGVERDNQFRGRHRVPDAKIKLIAAHHPPKEQVQPFTRAAGGRPWKEVTHAGISGHPAIYAADVE
jgi:hypothetical protein